MFNFLRRKPKPLKVDLFAPGQEQPRLEGALYGDEIVLAEMRKAQEEIGEGQSLIRRIHHGLAYDLWEASSPQGPVGVKILTEWFYHMYCGEKPDTQFSQDFIAACERQQRVNHPAIGKILRFGHSARAWVSRPFLPATTLAELLEQGPLTPGKTVSLLRELLDALEVAHAGGLELWGIKPQNVLFPSTGGLVMTDFGVPDLFANRYGFIFSLFPEDLPSAIRLPVTPADPPDLYALGSLAFECLRGAPAYTMDSIREWLAGVVPPLPGTPPELARLVTDLLHADPQRRPGLAEVRTRLDAI